VAQRITDPANLALAGKIVSVEGRHAAVIRDLLEPLTSAFAGEDVVDDRGLDRARIPSEVLQDARAFITNSIDASGLA
jgi:hypothetical protein